MQWDDPLVILLAIAVACLVMLTVVSVAPRLPTLRQAFVGVGVDPRLVGLVRGILLYLLPLGTGAAAVWMQDWTHPLLVPIAGSLVGIIRLGEASLDRWLKPAQNQHNPPPVAGGGAPGLAQL